MFAFVMPAVCFLRMVAAPVGRVADPGFYYQKLVPGLSINSQNKKLWTWFFFRLSDPKKVFLRVGYSYGCTVPNCTGDELRWEILKMMRFFLRDGSVFIYLEGRIRIQLFLRVEFGAAFFRWVDSSFLEVRISLFSNWICNSACWTSPRGRGPQSDDAPSFPFSVSGTSPDQTFL